MSSAGELLSSCHAGGSGADHGHGLAGLKGGLDGDNPTFFVGTLHDGELHGLDVHRIAADAQHTGTFTRSGAQAASELREVIGGVQAVIRFLPPILANQVIPLWDQVAQWAAVMAERDATVHAARGLNLHLFIGEVFVDFLPVQQTQWDWAVLSCSASVLLKAVRISHYFTSSMIAAEMPSLSRPCSSSRAMAVRTRA